MILGLATVALVKPMFLMEIAELKMYCINARLPLEPRNFLILNLKFRLVNHFSPPNTAVSIIPQDLIN